MSIYHKRTKKESPGPVKIEAILTDEEVEFEDFEVLCSGETSDKKIAILSQDKSFIIEEGKRLFVNGYDVYVADFQWNDRSLADFDEDVVTARLQPSLKTDKEWNEENLWGYLEWRVIEAPADGVYEKGKAITKILEVLVEAHYNGHLDPSSRRVALGKIVNAMRINRGKASYKSIARYQWSEAKSNFRHRRGLSKEEYREQKQKNKEKVRDAKATEESS